MKENHFDESNEKTFDYLFHIPIRDFTKDKFDSLQQSIEKLKGDISVLETTEPSKLWLKDLERFEKEYHKVYKQHD